MGGNNCSWNVIACLPARHVPQAGFDHGHEQMEKATNNTAVLATLKRLLKDLHTLFCDC